MIICQVGLGLKSCAKTLLSRKEKKSFSNQRLRIKLRHTLGKAWQDPYSTKTGFPTKQLTINRPSGGLWTLLLKYKIKKTVLSYFLRQKSQFNVTRGVHKPCVIQLSLNGWIENVTKARWILILTRNLPWNDTSWTHLNLYNFVKYILLRNDLCFKVFPRICEGWFLIPDW